MVGNARGFVEHRHLGGAVHPKTQRYRVKANPYELYAGDAVISVSGYCVRRAAVTATAAPQPILGIVRQVLNTDGRPFTHSLPSNPPKIGVSGAGWVDVNIDPDQTYLVDADATVASTHILQFVNASLGTPNSAAGRSGMNIEIGVAQNTAERTVPFQIIGLGFNDLGYPNQLVSGHSSGDVEVRIANHVFRLMPTSAQSVHV